MRLLFSLITGALGAAQFHKASFDRLKAITPPDSAPKMWLTKQAELVLLRLEHTEGLTEQTFRAFENFVTSTMNHSSESHIQGVANLLERVRTQLDVAVDFDSHEYFIMALALRIYDGLQVNILDRFPGLVVSTERQVILARLVVRLQALGIVKIEESFGVGICTRIGQLLQHLVNLDADELEVYTWSLEVAEQGMNRLTRASKLDVRFTYIPTALSLIYCAPPLISGKKDDRLETLRTVANMANDADLDEIALNWARTLRDASYITPRHDEQRNRPWKRPEMPLQELRSLSLALWAQHVLSDPVATVSMPAMKDFLDAYILADAYLKINPGADLVDLDSYSIRFFGLSYGYILRSITGGPAPGDFFEESNRLRMLAHTFRTGYPLDGGITVTPGSAGIAPIPSVHASQIRILNTMNVLAHNYPSTESFMRGIASLVHQRPFAFASHYNWLDSYLRSLQVPHSAVPERPQWDLAGVCEISHRFGVNIISRITSDAETIRLTTHVCEVMQFIPKNPRYPASWLSGNDPWLRHFSPIISQHWRAMREFQKRPFGISESVTGFIPSVLMTGGKYEPKTHIPFIRWYYSHDSALRADSALRGVSVNNIPIPADIVTRMAELSDPTHMFKPFIQFYENLYRTHFNNRATRMLVQRGVKLCKEAFITFIALKSAPETHQKEAQVYMESIWRLLKEFALSAEVSVAVADVHHPALAELRKVFESVATNLKSARWKLPFVESAYAREERVWNGKPLDATDETVKSFESMLIKFGGWIRNHIKTIKAATNALST